MAYNNDIVGLLTGTSSARLSPVAPTREQRMLERAGRYSQGMTQSIGQMFGTDLRTPAQKLQSGLKDIDMTNPDDLARLAKLQQATGDSAGAARTTAQRNAILEKQELSLEKQKGITQLNQQRTQFSEYLDKTYPNKGYGALALQGLITPANMKDFIKEAKEAKDYAVVGNSVYIPSTGEFIKGPTSSKAGTPQKEYNSETDQNELVWRDAQDPKIVLQRSPVAKAEDGEMSDADKRRTTSNRDLITTERATETMATDLADSYEGMLNKVNSGFYKSIEEGLKEILGRQDKITGMYLDADRLRVGRGVKNLPVGPASDKDVALVMKGELPANASPEAIISYARGIAKLARITKQDAMLENSWYDLYGDARGFSSYSEKERLEESFAGFPSGAIAELESNMSDETIKEFNAAFNVDYLDMRERLKRSNKILDELDRGF